MMIEDQRLPDSESTIFVVPSSSKTEKISHKDGYTDRKSITLVTVIVTKLHGIKRRSIH